VLANGDIRITSANKETITTTNFVVASCDVGVSIKNATTTITNASGATIGSEPFAVLVTFAGGVTESTVSSKSGNIVTETVIKTTNPPVTSKKSDTVTTVSRTDTSADTSSKTFTITAADGVTTKTFEAPNTDSIVTTAKGNVQVTTQIITNVSGVVTTRETTVVKVGPAVPVSIIITQP
jgi:hypothetical protein